jgi:hypothetical protein
METKMKNTTYRRYANASKMRLIGTLSRRLCAIAFVALIAFLVTTCDNGGGGAPAPKPYADFYGTWESADGSRYIISSNEITDWYAADDYLTWSLDTVTPYTNTDSTTKTDYPNGFIFEGKITKKEGYGFNIGDDCWTILYMHTNKKSICESSSNYIYFKQ